MRAPDRGRPSNPFRVRDARYAWRSAVPRDARLRATSVLEMSLGLLDFMAALIAGKDEVAGRAAERPRSASTESDSRNACRLLKGRLRHVACLPR